MPGSTVVEGAVCGCDMGDAETPLSVTSQELVTINDLPVATVIDVAPMVNIMPFGTCSIMTAAASGVPTPCVPAPTGTWEPGSLVQKINDLPVLTLPATVMCGIGGLIVINDSGQELETSD